MNKWLELLKNDDYLGIKKYIKDGADIDAVNDNGEGVLSNALRFKCDIDTMMLLIDAGADIYDFDEEGVSVFDMCIAYNNLEFFNYILEQGIDVNKTMRKSRFTPLMAATSYGRVEITKKLLELGADKDAVDDKGFKAIDFARKMNKKRVLELLN